MFYLGQKDKFSPVIAKNNLYTSIYIPLILYVLHLSNNLFKLGRYDNMKIIIVLIGLECMKFYFYKKAKLNIDTKQKRKGFKMEKLWSSISFVIQMLILFHVTSILLGAPFLSKFEQTFMFSCVLVVLSILPAILYFGVDDIFKLLDLCGQPARDVLTNTIMIQLQLTLLGGWLGAIPIPLDWNRDWQIWPNSCVLGAFGGCFLANTFSYIFHSTDLFLRNRKNQRFKNML